MNEYIIALLSIGVLASNLYWYSRYKSLKKGFRVSKEWDSLKNNDHRPQMNTELKKISNQLNCSVDDIPDAIEDLDTKIRELQSEISICRSEWAKATADVISLEVAQSSNVLLIDFKTGDSEDIKELADEVVGEQRKIVVVYSSLDNSFVVRSAEAANVSAINIAQDIVDNSAGGAGGSDEFAQGGSPVQNLFEKITESTREHTRDHPEVIRLGGGSPR
nr:DHHA1 domain-containing protein [Haloferax larsenii]